MIGKAYSFAKQSIGKVLRVGHHYLNVGKQIAHSLTPFYHQSGLSSVPIVRDVVDTAKTALGDYEKLRSALGI